MSLITSQIGGFYKPAAGGGTPAPVLDLGAGNGKAILPYTVLINGVSRYFYFWDINGDEVATDTITHAAMDPIFAAGGMSEADRTATLNGYIVSVARFGSPTYAELSANVGLLVTGTNTAVDSPDENQTLYEDCYAIWDSIATANGGNGTPPGWPFGTYFHTSTRGGVLNDWVRFAFSNGYASRVNHTAAHHVALEVLNPDFV